MKRSKSQLAEILKEDGAYLLKEDGAALLLEGIMRMIYTYVVQFPGRYIRIAQISRLIKVR